MLKLGRLVFFIAILLSIGASAYACKPVPFVDITQPVNNFTTDQDTLAVTVTFGPYRCKHKHIYTKTELIVLKIDNKKVAEYNVPKHDKDGSANFTVNISSYTEGSHVLKAFAYKDKKGKHQIAKSDPVIFIIKRTPPLPEPPEVTPQSGFIHGQVYDSNTNTPLSGASVTIEGITGTIVTNDQGKFTFPTPGTGDFRLTCYKSGYTLAQRKASVLTTRNTVVDDIYLKPYDTAVTTITNAGGTHTSANGKIIVTIPPNALPQGTTSINVQTTLFERSRELPAPLPKSSAYTYCLDLQPDGTQFTQLVDIKFANSLGFAPGTLIPIGLYNKATYQWDDSGLMSTVSADGQWVEFQMNHFSNPDCNNPADPDSQDQPATVVNLTSKDEDKTKHCSKDSGHSLVRLKTGELNLEHSLPAIRVQNQEITLTFAYNSETANPSKVIAIEPNLNTTIANVPYSTTFKLKIEDRNIQASYTGTAGKSRESYLYNCKNEQGAALPTGTYPYMIEASNDFTNVNYGTANYFGGPPTGNTGVPTIDPVSITSTINGSIVVNNQQDSPFGSGWGLIGLERLHFNPDGTLLLTEGDSSAKTFKKEAIEISHFMISPEGGRVLSILSNNGGEYFTASAATVAGVTSSDNIIADFNNDAIPDVAIGGDLLSILLGKADGSFETRALVNTGGEASWYITTADFNKDGFVDLAATNQISNTVSIFLGQGDGNFNAPQQFLTGNDPRQVCAADLNNDSFVDLAMCNFSANSISILLGNGDGTFQGPLYYSVSGAEGPVSISAADLNKDGLNDLVVANTYTLNFYVMIGKTDGTLQEPRLYGFTNPAWITSSTIADFNNDSVLDVAVTTNGNKIYCFTGNGDGTFKAVPYILGSTGYGANYDIVAGDFNADELTDFAVTDNGFSIYLGIGDGTFQQSFHNPNVGGLAGVSVLKRSLYPPDAYTCATGDYSYIMQNADTTYTRFLKDGSQILFNTQGLQIQAKDKNGNSTTYTYIDANSDGKAEELAVIILPTGAQYQLNYTNGKLSSITDPAARVTGFTVDSQGDLTRIVNADGTSRYFIYDANHLMTRKTDERGNSAEYFYDQYGAIRDIFSPEREVTEIAADGTVATSRKTEMRKYDISNRKGLINDLPAGTGTIENPAEVVSADEVVEKKTDAKGNIWAYKTNKFGGRREFTDPLNNTIAYERDSYSNLTKLTRANSSTVEMRYDGKGNLVFVQESANNAQTKITYEPKYNQPTSITDPLGNITTIEYDAKGNPNKITDSAGTITTMEYNTRGQVTKVTSAFGTALENQTAFAYDPNTFNLTSVTDPLNRTTSFIYNSAGNVEQITDANGKISTFTYDSMNRVKIARDADGKVTTYTYDNLGNLVSITDANNHTTTFTYDEQNQLTRTTNPLNEQKLYAYDINRNLSMIVTPKGAQIKLYNNPANIVEKKFLPEGEVGYTYDSEYNLTHVVNVDSDLTFTYDLLSRLTQTQTAGTVQPATSISYSYDVNNNLVSMTNPAGIVTNYIYDTLNRLTDIKDQTNQVISHYDYDVLSRRTGKSVLLTPTILTTNYTYDIASQLLSITNLPTTITNSYTYDNVGNRLSLTDNNGLHNYSYDNVYRLLSASNPAENYTYDPVGNRNPLTQSYDSGNRLLDDGTYTYTYDLNGNMTSKEKKVGGETTTYNYNSEDQLIGVNNNIIYKYDAFGRRIEKNVSGTITRYVYDGEDIIQELDGNNTLVTSYVHGPSIDEPILLEKNNQKYYYISDGLGNITTLVDQNGNIAQTYRYDSFGNILSQTGSLTQPYTYTGREYDSETGLYYYRARYYDEHAGGFLQADPLLNVNLYIYCGDNPLNYVDPLGLLELYYWEPAGGGSKGGWYGHVSIKLDDGTYISYWPNRPLSGNFDSTAPRPPDYNQDLAGEGYRQPQKLSLTGLDECKIKNWWDQGNHGNFSVFNNCSTIVSEALRQGGAKIPHHLIYQPTQVKNDIDKYLHTHHLWRY